MSIVKSYLTFNSTSINRSIQSFHWIKKEFSLCLCGCDLNVRLQCTTAFFHSIGALLISLNLFHLSINNFLTNGNAKRPFVLTMNRVNISFAKKAIKRIICIHNECLLQVCFSVWYKQFDFFCSFICWY